MTSRGGRSALEVKAPRRGELARPLAPVREVGGAPAGEASASARSREARAPKMARLALLTCTLALAAPPTQVAASSPSGRGALDARRRASTRQGAGARAAAPARPPTGASLPAPPAGASVPAPPAAEAADLPPVSRVVDRINDLFRSDSSEARFSMKVVTDRYRRELLLESFTRGKAEALVVVREPAREAGAATLRSQEGLWSYAPRADRLVRIPGTLLSDSWMGSHFTNDDLMRQTDFTRDYDAALAWASTGGSRMLQATLRPRPDAPVVWSRIVYLLEPRDYLPVRADYFDDHGQVARTLTFADPRLVSGRRVPFSLRMVPADKPGESTIIDYEQIEFGVAIDPGIFTQRALRRGVGP